MHFRFFSISCLLALLAALSTRPALGNSVVISEFMASNSSTLVDEDGEFSDWIELLNLSTNLVNLGGWSLTDDAGDLGKWSFPSTNLPPGGYLVVFASNKDRRVAGRPLHTNFKLDPSGEYLALVQPNGLSVAWQFSPAYPAQLPNISYGPGLQQSQGFPVSTNSVGRLLVPLNGALGLDWTLPGFNDSGWGRATNGLGYELGTSEQPPAALHVMNGEPIGYWRLNETTGSAANLGTLGSQADGTSQGTVLAGQPGLRPPAYGGFESNNTALRFGNAGAHVTTGQSLLNGRYAFTLSGWFNAQSLATSRIGLWGQNDAIEFGFINPSTLSLWTPGGGSLDVAAPVTLNAWHHVAAVGDGTALRIYLDGQLLGEAPGNTLDYGSSPYPFNIGGGGIWDPSGNEFDGYIDEVSIYDRAMGADEILWLYRSASGGMAGLDYLAHLNPEAWWRLNETNGGTAFNSGTLGSVLDLPFLGSPTLGVAGIQPPAQGGFETNNLATGLNGTTSRIESSAFQPDLSTPVFSVSAWARLAGGTGERVVVSSRDYGIARGYVLAASTNRWRYYIADTNGFKILEGPLLTSNSWVHLVATFNGSTANFYVNGALSASTNLGQFQPNTANRFRIGYGSYNGSSGYFPGSIDEVAYFKRALAGSEVTNLHTAALTGNAPAGTTNFYYSPFIRTNLLAAIYGINSSAYWRVPFQILNPADIASLRLRTRHDDGFAAFFNGTPVEAANVPPSLSWNSAALSERTSSQASRWQEYDLTGERGWLVPGTNWLAVQALNVSPTNSDLLFQCELELGIAGTGLSPSRYFTVPTPGNANGAGAADLGPILSQIASLPVLPTQPLVTDAITVTARVQPAFAALSAVTLNWRVMFNALNQTPMLDDGFHGDGAAGDGVYGAIIPAGVAQSGQMVRWFITASDANDRTSRWPLFTTPTDSEEYLGTVVSDPSIQSALPVLHSFIQNLPAADSRTGTRCSLFYNGEFYDNMLMSLHGQSSSGWAKKPYNLDFNKDHRFKYLPGQPRQKDAKLLSNWGDKARVRNALSHEFLAKSGSASHWCFQVRVQRNGMFHSIADLMEDADDLWMERLNWDPDGALYKIYNNLSSASGAEKKTRQYEGTADLNALVTNLNESLPIDTRATYGYDNLDLPQVISYFAGLALISSQDHGHKNYYVYRDSNASLEWSILPWDTDLSWGRNWLDSAGYFTDTLYANNVLNFYPGASVQNKGSNRLYNLVFDYPDFRRMYLRRLRTVADKVLQPPGTPAAKGKIETRIRAMMDQMDPPTVGTSDADLDYSKWGSWGNNYAMRPEAQRIIDSYLPSRRAWLNSSQALLSGELIPPSQPTNVSLAILGVDFNPASRNQAEEYICITNANAFAVDISDWCLAGAVGFQFRPGTVIPANAATYVSPSPAAFRSRSLPPRAGQKRFVTGPYSGQLSARGELIELQDDSGRLVTTFTYPGSPSPQQQFLRISELMFNPDMLAGSPWDPQEFEFIELLNISTNTSLNLKGIWFSRGVSFAQTNNYTLSPGQRCLIVKNPAAFASRYGSGALILGTFIGSLDNAGERVTLLDEFNEEILDFSYNDTWHPMADGLGFSLVTVNPLAEPDSWDGRSQWHSSAILGGGPGAADPGLSLPAVLVNEILSHTDLPQLDSIELFNPGSNTVAIGGWFLTDDFYTPKKYRIPVGTSLASGRFAVFDESHFNTDPGASNSFRLSSMGDDVWLFSGDAQTNLTGFFHGFTFGASANGVSFGRHVNSTGTEQLVAQTAPSLGATNLGPRVSPVLVSGILFQPPRVWVNEQWVEDDNSEFVQISNWGSTPVPLFDPAIPTNSWRLSGAVDYQFPSHLTLQPGTRILVVNFNPTNSAALAVFKAKYPFATNIPLFGPWSGQLANEGESVRLRYPDLPNLDGTIPYIVADQVDYLPGFPWPVGAAGTGAGLWKTDLSAYGNDPFVWEVRAPAGTPVTDGDHDGMADWWELRHGLNTATNDAPLDPDLDGFINAKEYVARLDPHNPSSVLRLDGLQTPAGLRLRFVAQPEVGYTVQRSSAITPSSWEAYQHFAATNTTLQIDIQIPPGLNGFFRLVTPQQP